MAERLVQSRGFNGFSYADASQELGITNAALHYHFSGKAELGEALVHRYAERFRKGLASIDDRITGTPAKLDAYVDLYLGVLRDGRMCLCGMLAAEYQTLPAEMQQAVLRFFEENEAWLADVVQHGQDDGTIQFGGSPNAAAHLIISVLEGAMLLARSFDDMARFQSAADALFAGLELGHHGSDRSSSPTA